MIKQITIIVSVLLISGCSSWTRFSQPTKTFANTTGIGMTHSPSVESPPSVEQDKKEEALPVPAGSTVIVTETGPTDKSPATVETKIVLPSNKGMNITKTDVKTKMVGSKGFEPEKGPTPTQRATAAWTYAGIGIAALGIFFCTPWGGSNYRVGACVSAGGVAMSMIGKFIDQITIPAPVMGLLFVGFALAMYYGYRIRHKQVEQVPLTA